MLDRRLQACADMVNGTGIVCDVGTDHAYLAAELIRSGKCDKVIASDINEKPLEAARATVEKYGISDKVELILSDGLKEVPLDGVSDIVIAGMGGETIADIIENMDWCNFEFEDVRFILQPMTKPEFLRKYLFEHELMVTDEKIIEDGNKTYVVMCVEYNTDYRYITEFESINGFFDEEDPLAEKYRLKESERVGKIAESMKNTGRDHEVAHYSALSEKLKSGVNSVRIDEIYDYLDSLYPFNIQEKWDNSGLLVENTMMRCEKILLSLDISESVINEAACKGADLIISHHPVIFDPIKKISRNDPVYYLIENDIAAMCLHTNLDIANGGTNGVILRELCKKFNIIGEPVPFEEIGENNLGWIIELEDVKEPKELAAELKKIFGCEYIRLNAESYSYIKKIAFCSGSGGSMLRLACEKGCDALITGDVKHDVWIDANNIGIALFDCGHFHTENIVLPELRYVLEKKFPRLDIEIADNSTDPCVYL